MSPGISAFVESIILNQTNDCSAYSIMVNESTDVSVLKQLILCGCAVSKLKLKTCYLKLVNLVDGKEPTIVSAITSYLHSVHLNIETIVHPLGVTRQMQ